MVQFQCQRALVTVDYYSGFLTYDTLSSETTNAVTKALNNIFISEKVRCFCDRLDIVHGRAERAITTVEQILKKSANYTDITKALITYLDTPISDT